MRTQIVAACAAAGILAAALAAVAQPAAPDAVALKAGKEIFEKSCKLCHSLDRPLAQIKGAKDWEATVIHMVGNGAKLDEPQKAQVVTFLSAKSLFETKCNLCHSVSLPLGKAKSAAEWVATVQKMVGKKPGHLSEQEAATVAAYLALERPAR
jgi:cytochrome c5